MTDATIGWGSEFSLNNGTILTELAEVFEVGLPNDTVDEVEATHYKSPQRRREYIAGLIDGGTFTVSMNYIAGSPTDLLLSAAKAAGAKRAWQTIIPNGDDDGGWQFDGFGIVTGYEKAIPLDDRLTAVATIRVSGAVTEAAVA